MEKKKKQKLGPRNYVYVHLSAESIAVACAGPLLKVNDGDISIRDFFAAAVNKFLGFIREPDVFEKNKKGGREGAAQRTNR